MSFYRLRVQRGKMDLIPMVTSETPLQSFSVGELVDFGFADDESGAKITEPVKITDVIHLLEVDEKNNATAHLVTLVVE